MRTGPNALSFCTPTALHDIYGSRSVNVRKSVFYRILDSGSGAFSTHTEIDKTKHAVRRRVLSYAFSDNAVRFSEQFVLAHVKRWCELLAPPPTKDAGAKREWSEPRNMKDWGNWLTYDIMGDLAFGTRLNLLESEENRYIPVVMTEGTKFGYWVRFCFVFKTAVGNCSHQLSEGTFGRCTRKNRS